MDVMANPTGKPTGASPALAEGRSLKRVELEMALKIGGIAGRSAEEKVRKAAITVGGDLLFVLPARDGPGATAIIRLKEKDKSRFIELRISDSAFTIVEEADIDADLLGFARTSLSVLEQLKTEREHPSAPTQ